MADEFDSTPIPEHLYREFAEEALRTGETIAWVASRKTKEAAVKDLLQPPEGYENC